ncbi:MAG: caspase family protein [Acidimicrobiia bacterium]
MADRALLIGSETGGLAGVHSDVEVMEHALAGLGFTTIRAIEGAAARDEILARYRGLIEDSRPGDAAVIYYSGHGGRQRNEAAIDPRLPAWLHFIVPTDIDDRSGGRFGGLLAEELSLLQLELTARTDNVTTILDCCHSSRMSRAAAALPKADSSLARWPWEDIEERWRAAIDDPAVRVAAESNPKAVRLVACSVDQSAYEMPETDLGGPHGLLTSRLVPVLTSAQARSLTWREVLDIVRPAVVEAVTGQRPEVEGPLDRLLFRTEVRTTTGVLPVVVADHEAWLDGASLFGMAEGDSYAVVAPGGDPSAPLATAEVAAVAGDRARLVLAGTAADDLPPGAAAHPGEVALGARPIAVVPADHPRRAEVTDALRRSSRLRVADGGTEVLATVHLDGDTAQVLDGGGAPLHEPPRDLSAAAVALIGRDLERLARATHVRALVSARADASLPDDVEVSYARLLDDGGEVALTVGGEHLFAGDRVVVRFRSTSDDTRYASVLDVGIAGAVSLLTGSEPAGVTLAPGDAYTVGLDGTGALVGLGLFWPGSVPEVGPRPETFVVVVADDKIDNLGRLQQEGVSRDLVEGGRGRSALEQLVDDLSVGRRDAMPAAAAAKALRYRVDRFDFLFHPGARPDEAAEPLFEIDTRPDPSLRLMTPKARGVVPTRASVRLHEVTVHSNRAILRARVRLDALVLSAPAAGGDAPYQATTARFDRVKDGDRLPLDRWLVFDGPVGRFLDLAVWVAKDEDDGPGLAELLKEETGKDDVKAALATLAGLAVAAPQAALIAGAAAAVGTLVASAARLLGAVQGHSIGVYRTTFLPHESLGSGEGIARHPASGLLRANDMSFAFEVIDPDRA